MAHAGKSRRIAGDSLIFVAMSSSCALTRGIRVEVRSQYSPEHSDPAEDRWFFVYAIRITNESGDPVQLLRRHWIIADAMGEVEEVEGPGVVGEQPRLEPGESYEYSSGCPLGTPFGSMRGSYHMTSDSGASFDAEVSEFTLRDSGAIH
jgi:ApaG protein